MQRHLSSVSSRDSSGPATRLTLAWGRVTSQRLTHPFCGALCQDLQLRRLIPQSGLACCAVRLATLGVGAGLLLPVTAQYAADCCVPSCNRSTCALKRKLRIFRGFPALCRQCPLSFWHPFGCSFRLCASLTSAFFQEADLTRTCIISAGSGYSMAVQKQASSQS